MSFATFTITPNDTATGGTYTLGGVTFNYTDTPTLSGWSLTSGTDYNSGFTFTCNFPGSQSQPSFDDSLLLNGGWNGSINSSGFADGADASSAVQVLGVAAGTNYYPTGNWTLGDWTGDVNTVPTPTGWTVSTSLIGAINGSPFYATANSPGPGQTPLSWDTSALIGSDANPWDGSISQTSFTDGTNATYATQPFVLGSAGSKAPSSIGTWALTTGPTAAPDSYPTATGWTVTTAASFLDLVNSAATLIYTCDTSGSGQSGFGADGSGVSMVVAAATVTFVDGSAGFNSAWAVRNARAIHTPLLG